MAKQYFVDKKVLITGASSGIGRATALAFAQQGARLALVARNSQRLQAVAEECAQKGATVSIYLADTSEKEQIETAVSDMGGLDIVHCNAGIYLRCPAKDLTIGQIQRIMATNYYGTLNTVYAVLPYFIEKKGGSLVTTVSMDGKKGVPPDAAYVSSKFALNGYMQVLRQELKPLGIHVGTIFPSRTDTPQIAHVKCPAITPKADPSLVAKAVLRCVRKHKSEVLVPGFSCKLLVWADTISPAFGDWMVKAFKLDGQQEGEPVVKEAGL